MKNLGLYLFSEIKQGMKIMHGEFSGFRENDKYSLKIMCKDKEVTFWQVKYNFNILRGLIQLPVLN